MCWNRLKLGIDIKYFSVAGNPILVIICPKSVALAEQLKITNQKTFDGEYMPIC